MPLLFYGNIGLSKDKVMYAERFRAIKSDLYDYLKIDNLAPYHRGDMVWNHWWIRIGRPHTCIAWNGMHHQEQLVFMPGELDWRNALIIARDTFGTAIPSAIVFRVNNHKGAYIYD